MTSTKILEKAYYANPHDQALGYLCLIMKQLLNLKNENGNKSETDIMGKRRLNILKGLRVDWFSALL